MGHKPSATAEKHYKVRPLGLLAVHHRRIEEWILEQAARSFDFVAAARPTLVKAAVPSAPPVVVTAEAARRAAAKMISERRWACGGGDFLFS